MANMDVTDREGYERATLSGSEQQIRRGSEGGAAIYSVIALIIGVALCYGALTLIDSWAQWLVLGIFAAFTFAVAFAVGPNRAGAGRTETGIDA